MLIVSDVNVGHDRCRTATGDCHAAMPLASLGRAGAFSSDPAGPATERAGRCNVFILWYQSVTLLTVRGCRSAD